MITLLPGWRAACRRIWFSVWFPGTKNDAFGNLHSSVPGMGKYNTGTYVSKHDVKKALAGNLPYQHLLKQKI